MGRLRVVGARRWPVALVVVAVGIGSLGLSGCVGGPSPRIGTATAGDGQAVVSWQPSVYPEPIVGYVVTPWIGFERQTPVVFNSTATTETVAGLRNGVAYGFSVHGVAANGDESAESNLSNGVTPGPQIATGNTTCAIVAGGAVDCWGYNQFGELGDGSTIESHVPVAVTGLTGVTAVTAGNAHM